MFKHQNLFTAEKSLQAAAVSLFFKTLILFGVCPALADNSLALSREKCVLFAHLTEKQCDIAARKSRDTFLKQVQHFSSREFCEKTYGRMRCSIDSAHGKIFFIPQQDSFRVKSHAHLLTEVVPLLRGHRLNVLSKPSQPFLPADAVTELPPSNIHQFEPASKAGSDDFRCSDYVVQEPGAPADSGCLPGPPRVRRR